jgi:hypothetical protein
MSIEKLIHNNQEWEKFKDEEDTYYITLNDGRYNLLNEKGQRLDKMDFNSTYKLGKNILDKKILDRKENDLTDLKEEEIIVSKEVKSEKVEEKQIENEFENVPNIYKYIQNKYGFNLNVISKKVPNTENDKYNLILVGNKVIGETFPNSKKIKSHCSINELDEISKEYVSKKEEKHNSNVDNKIEIQKNGKLNVEEIKKLSVNEIKEIIEEKIKINEILRKQKEELAKKIEKEKQEVEKLKLQIEEMKEFIKNNSINKNNIYQKEKSFINPTEDKNNDFKELKDTEEKIKETNINSNQIESNEISFERLDELSKRGKSLLKECSLTKEDVMLPNLNSKYKTVDTSKDNENKFDNKSNSSNDNIKKEVKTSNHKQK